MAAVYISNCRGGGTGGGGAGGGGGGNELHFFRTVAKKKCHSSATPCPITLVDISF